MDSNLEVELKHRLIVLVPDCLAGSLDMARKVYSIAQSEDRDVLYLTLVDDDEKMIAVSRSMATMKAVTAGQWLVVNSRLTGTGHWLAALREIYRPGDMIVCHEEQSVKDGFLRTQPVSEFLRATLKAPVRIISGFYHPQKVQAVQWLRGLLFWLGCLVILAGFTLLEIRLDQATAGAAHTWLLMVALVFEFGSVWVWNIVTSR
jgi:hypothetical protein